MIINYYWFSLVLAGYMNGIGAMDGFAPFLRIPNDQYYLWEAIFIVPVSLGGWIMIAGIVQLVARQFGGYGDFERTVALLGWTNVVIIPVSLLPEFIVLVFFPTIWFDP